MLRALASLLFYSRFFTRFSRVGLRRRERDWLAYPERLDGQTWLVTGASGGIGAAIASTAHARGARVLAAARSQEKLGELVRAAGDSGRMVPLRVDFSSIADARRLLQELISRGERIDVLINNVGLLLDRFELTPEGLETSFVTNLLSHYALTEGLRTAGRFADGAAVINMSSGGMYGSPLRVSEMAAATASEHDGMAAYARPGRTDAGLEPAMARSSAGLRDAPGLGGHCRRADCPAGVPRHPAAVPAYCR